MKEKELEELSLLFNDVFDSNGRIKDCGLALCMKLIIMMKKYSSEDVGDERTGIINVETMKSEYLKIYG